MDTHPPAAVRDCVEFASCLQNCLGNCLERAAICLLILAVKIKNRDSPTLFESQGCYKRSSGDESKVGIIARGARKPFCNVVAEDFVVLYQACHERCYTTNGGLSFEIIDSFHATWCVP